MNIEKLIGQCQYITRPDSLNPPQSPFTKGGGSSPLCQRGVSGDLAAVLRLPDYFVKLDKSGLLKDFSVLGDFIPQTP